MENQLSIEEAGQLAALARKAISYYLATGNILKDLPVEEKFKENRGVFVTLKTFPEQKLRGCIGLPYPITSLWQGVIQAAVSAAFNDPRFPPLKEEELDKLVVEISVLTLPKPINCSKKELPEKINIGKDGLIVKKGERSGLLLPQVATEEELSPKEFLELTCRKALLPETAWMSSSCTVLKFQAQVFREKEPQGKVFEELTP